MRIYTEFDRLKTETRVEFLKHNNETRGTVNGINGACYFLTNVFAP